MFFRIAVVCAAIAAAPSAFAQQAPVDPLYVSGGLAWSGELGLEIEAGVQTEIGDALLLRFAPINLSLFDGDVPDGFHWSGTGSGRDCIDNGSNSIVPTDYCSPEPDSEWRSVVEAQFRVAPGFRIGAGAAYLLQGDYDQDASRFEPFASLSWDLGDGVGVALRGGQEYFAVQLRGLW